MRRSIPARDALMIWATVTAVGTMHKWKPDHLTRGTPMYTEDYCATVAVQVERFFALSSVRDRGWRQLAYRILWECHEPTMREEPEWSECAHRFKRWLREHPIMEPTGDE